MNDNSHPAYEVLNNPISQSQLYEPTNVRALLSLINDPKVSYDKKRELLVEKIVFDWSKNPGAYFDPMFGGNDRINMIDKSEESQKFTSKVKAIQEYVSNLHSIKFSRVIYLCELFKEENHINIRHEYLKKIKMLNELVDIDIEKLTVLARNSSMTLYGSAGRDGVIIISGNQRKK